MEISKETKEVVGWALALTAPYLPAWFFDSYFPVYYNFVMGNLLWFPAAVLFGTVFLILWVQATFQAREDKKSRKTFEAIVKLKRGGRFN